MTPPLKLEHIRTVTVGEEDEAPVHVALLRCCLFTRIFGVGDEPVNPDPTILWWDDESDTDTIEDETVFTRTVAVAHHLPALDFPAWVPVEPDMDAVYHGVVWHTGHQSSSATVSDVYLDDQSTLLTVITPAHQQWRNTGAGLTEAYQAGDRSP